MMLRRTVTFAATTAVALALVGCGGIGDAQSKLRTAVDAKKPTLDSCYGQALERNEGLTGSMTVVLHVAEKDGAVTDVDVASSTVHDPVLAECVETAIVGTSIDPPPEANLEVEYQIEFTPTAPDEEA